MRRHRLSPLIGGGLRRDSEATSSTTRRRVLLAAVAAATCVLALEAAARLYWHRPRVLNARYVALSQNLPELPQLIADVHASGGAQYFDEFLYAQSETKTRYVNFTSYYSARLTPDSVPLSDAEHIVWTFGGSTMENTETTDSLTIANTWAVEFNRARGPTHVKNFGAGGFFSSYELIKFQKLLREVPREERATISIFYDGYTDAEYGFQYGPGSLQKDLSLKLQALVQGQHARLLTYASSQLLLRYSRLWERTGARAVEAWLFPLPAPRPTAENLAAAVHIYTSNVRMISATCEAFGLRCVFVLQPLIFTKTSLAPAEQEVIQRLEAHPRYGKAGVQFIRSFYAEVARILGDNPRFLDASDILNGREDADFYDPGHVAATSAAVIGRKTAELILARLRQLEADGLPKLGHSIE